MCPQQRGRGSRAEQVTARVLSRSSPWKLTRQDQRGRTPRAFSTWRLSPGRHLSAHGDHEREGALEQKGRRELHAHVSRSLAAPAALWSCLASLCWPLPGRENPTRTPLPRHPVPAPSEVAGDPALWAEPAFPCFCTVVWCWYKKAPRRQLSPLCPITAALTRAPCCGPGAHPSLLNWGTAVMCHSPRHSASAQPHRGSKEEVATR